MVAGPLAIHRFHKYVGLGRQQSGLHRSQAICRQVSGTDAAQSTGGSPAGRSYPSGYGRLQPRRCRNKKMNRADTARSIPARPLENRRSLIDRRSGEDRRKAYSLDYFLNGGIERRKGVERRKNGERRADWRQVDKWYSVFCGDE